jgi:GT2 family glycosyltransferase
MSLPYVISVILNTNRRDDTLACLSSLTQSTYPNHSVIVLDNDSSDGSIEAIQEKYPCTLIVSLEKNMGYAGNNNVGIEIALQEKADWVFILNEDTVLNQNCIDKLVSEGEKDRKIGIVGPMVYHYDEPEYIQSAGGMLGQYWESIHIAKNELDTGQMSTTHQVEWVSGCAIMVRSEVVKDIGMLDARFFYYWEETEWCLRAAKAGHKIMHVPSAKLWHKGVQRDYTPKPSLMYYDTRNHLLLLKKHHAPIKVWFYTVFKIIRTLLSWSIRPKWCGKKLYRNAMFQGSIDFLFCRWGKQEI